MSDNSIPAPRHRSLGELAHYQTRGGDHVGTVVITGILPAQGEAELCYAVTAHCPITVFDPMSWDDGTVVRPAGARFIARASELRMGGSHGRLWLSPRQAEPLTIAILPSRRTWQLGAVMVYGDPTNARAETLDVFGLVRIVGLAPWPPEPDTADESAADAPEQILLVTEEDLRAMEERGEALPPGTRVVVVPSEPVDPTQRAFDRYFYLQALTEIVDAQDPTAIVHRPGEVFPNHGMFLYPPPVALRLGNAPFSPPFLAN